MPSWVSGCLCSLDVEPLCGDAGPEYRGWVADAVRSCDDVPECGLRANASGRVRCLQHVRCGVQHRSVERKSSQPPWTLPSRPSTPPFPSRRAPSLADFLQIYRADDSPLYRRGNTVLLVILAWNLALILGTKSYYKQRNASRARKWDAMTAAEREAYLAGAKDAGNKRLVWLFVPFPRLGLLEPVWTGRRSRGRKLTVAG